MSFWAVLSNCFNVSSPAGPISTVTIKKFKLSALFDTGSSFTLINPNLKSKLISANDLPVKGNPIKLCAANGQLLNSKGTYLLDITLTNRSFQIPVQFIDNLQLPCIIGMDFMSKANITICASSQKIKIGQSRRQTSSPVVTTGKIQLPAYSETLVPLNVNGSFSSALIEGSASLPEGICLMEDIVSANNDKYNAVFANFTHLPVTVPAYSSVAHIHIGPLTALPIDSCLSSQPRAPVLASVGHLKCIDLSHLPYQYQAQSLEGELDIVEIRRYPATHPDPKRANAQIIAFEGNDQFLKSLYKHHRDFAFNIKICLLYTSPSPRD